MIIALISLSLTHFGALRLLLPLHGAVTAAIVLCTVLWHDFFCLQTLTKTAILSSMRYILGYGLCRLNLSAPRSKNITEKQPIRVQVEIELSLLFAAKFTTVHFVYTTLCHFIQCAIYIFLLCNILYRPYWITGNLEPITREPGHKEGYTLERIPVYHRAYTHYRQFSVTN